MVRFVSAVYTILSWTLVTSFHSLSQTRRRTIHSTLFTTKSSVLGEFVHYTHVSMEELIAGIVPCEVTIKPPTLRNKYYGLRHGESMANLEGIISSDPGRGTTIHGLTETGRHSFTLQHDVLNHINHIIFYCPLFTIVLLFKHLQPSTNLSAYTLCPTCICYVMSHNR